MNWQVFDIIGPVMVGPSSSHTSGAVRLGLLAHILMGGIPDKATIYLHGSYGEVYKGHGTDKALIAGLLGLYPDSEKVVTAFAEAKRKKLSYSFITTDLGIEYHPNTAKFVLQKDREKLEIIGSSIGAGNVEIVEINGITTASLNGKYETLITLQKDVPGMVAKITGFIAEARLNIAQMSIGRNKKGSNALTIINLDDHVSAFLLEKIKQIPRILWARVLPKLT